MFDIAMNLGLFNSRLLNQSNTASAGHPITCTTRHHMHHARDKVFFRSFAQVVARKSRTKENLKQNGETDEQNWRKWHTFQCSTGFSASLTHFLRNYCPVIGGLLSIWCLHTCTCTQTEMYTAHRHMHTLHTDTGIHTQTQAYTHTHR